MKLRITMALNILPLIAVLAGHAGAADCTGPDVRTTEADKKFSVVMPAAAGMGSQSFDDIGCAVLSRNGECATRQSTFDCNALVVDYTTGEKVPVEQAFFAIKTDIKTPRGYSIAAFKDKAGAKKFAAEHHGDGVVMWSGLIDTSLK